MADTDRLKTALTKMVLAVTRRQKYLARYPATAVAQNADGTLELVVDDPSLPHVSKVKVRLGIPDATVKVQPKARVLLAFDGGDPRYPFAELWDSSSIIELVIAGGANGVARVGDACSFNLTAGGYKVVGTINISAGSAKVKVG